jgi:hypothetical protein
MIINPHGTYAAKKQASAHITSAFIAKFSDGEGATTLKKELNWEFDFMKGTEYGPDKNATKDN